MSEQCQRCNTEGEDSRTLSMACFYDMGELGLPFEIVAIWGKRLKQTATQVSSLTGSVLPVFEPGTNRPDDLYVFFTLRVCKSCRADWMKAIQDWFESEPESEDGDLQAGTIYTRELGANRRVS